jgi:peroxin-2
LKPEIGLAIKLIVFRYSFFGDSTALPGARLQNLKLVNRYGSRRKLSCYLVSRMLKAYNVASRRKLLLFLLLHPPIFPSYILTRLREYGLSNQWPDLPSSNWRRKAWRVVVWMENLARIWELGGWGMLIWDGRFVSAGLGCKKELIVDILHY